MDCVMMRTLHRNEGWDNGSSNSATVAEKARSGVQMEAFHAMRFYSGDLDCLGILCRCELEVQIMRRDFWLQAREALSAAIQIWTITLGEQHQVVVAASSRLKQLR